MSAEETKLKDTISHIIGEICAEHYGTGPLAALRRVNPADPLSASPSLHRLLARHVDEHELYGDGMRRWVLLVHLFGLAAPDGLHDAAALGAALFAASYNEGRLTRLLKADASDFAIVLPRMVRFLVAKGERVNPFGLAWLVLTRDSEAQSRLRLSIARDYYRAESQAARRDAA